MFKLALINRRTGERFHSRTFGNLDAALAWGERLDESEWLWAV